MKTIITNKTQQEALVLAKETFGIEGKIIYETIINGVIKFNVKRDTYTKNLLKGGCFIIEYGDANAFSVFVDTKGTIIAL